MGQGSKVFNVLLRIWELVRSAVVLGLVARFIQLVSNTGGTNDGRLIYTLVVASISTLYSILFMPPFMCTFLAFPADFILFVAWLFAFCLLVTRVATNTCNSYWYYNYWGYYWGGLWYYPDTWNDYTNIAVNGCSQWRTVLAFSFMAFFTFLASFFLGLYVVIEYYGEGRGAKTHGPISQPTPIGGPQTSQVPGTGPQSTAVPPVAQP